MGKHKAALLAVAIVTFLTCTRSFGQGRTGFPDALNVNVTNSDVPVIVSNSASNPVPVTIGEPFSVTVQRNDCTTTYSCFMSLPEIPQGKMLVVEYLNLYANPPLGSAAIYDFVWFSAHDSQESGRFTKFAFPMARIGFGNVSSDLNLWSVSTPVLATVRVGQSYSVEFVTRAGGAEGVLHGATISGHLIDAPQ